MSSNEFDSSTGPIIIQTGAVARWVAVILTAVAMLSAAVYGYGALTARISYLETKVDVVEKKLDTKVENARFADFKDDVCAKLDDIKIDLKEIQKTIKYR